MSFRSRDSKWFSVAMLVLVVTRLCGCDPKHQEQPTAREDGVATEHGSRNAIDQEQVTATQQLTVFSESSMLERLDAADVTRPGKEKSRLS